MKLYLEGHEYKYAVEQMLLTLYPEERPEYPEGRPEGKRMEIRLSEGEKRLTASCLLVNEQGRFSGRACADRASSSCWRPTARAWSSRTRPAPAILNLIL